MLVLFIYFVIEPLPLIGVWLDVNKIDGIMSSIFVIVSEQNCSALKQC